MKVIRPIPTHGVATVGPSSIPMDVENLESMTRSGAGDVHLPDKPSITSGMDNGHESSNSATAVHENMLTSNEDDHMAEVMSVASDVASSTSTSTFIMINSTGGNVAENGTNHIVKEEGSRHSDGSAGNSASDSGIGTPLTDVSNSFASDVSDDVFDVFDFFSVLNVVYGEAEASNIIEGIAALGPEAFRMALHQAGLPITAGPPPVEDIANSNDEDVSSMVVEEGSDTPTTSHVPEPPRQLGCLPCVLSVISSYQSLEEIQVLARTDDAFRGRLHVNCCEAIANMTVEEFVAYQTVRAHAMPDQVVCALCHKLHRAMTGDVPGEELCQFCPDNESAAMVHAHGADLGYGYCIQYHQVQLALKLKRLSRLTDPPLDEESRQYLVDILRPFHITSHGTNTRVAVEVDIRPVVTLEPRPSFIVMREIVFSQLEGEGSQPLEASTIQHFAVCPHASVSEYDREDMQCEALYGTIEDACLGLRSRRRFFCTRCPTDVEIETEPGCLHVRVWHDFGPEGVTPLDAAWLVHVGGSQNNEYLGHTVPHGRGTVRMRYENAQRKVSPLDPTMIYDSSYIEPLTSEYFDHLARANYWQRVAARSRLEYYLYNRKVLGMAGEAALQM